MRELWIFALHGASCNFSSFSAKAQKIEMDKLEKAKKERTKVTIQNKKRLRCRVFVCFPAEFHFVALLFLMNCALC